MAVLRLREKTAYKPEIFIRKRKHRLFRVRKQHRPGHHQLLGLSVTL